MIKIERSFWIKGFIIILSCFGIGGSAFFVYKFQNIAPIYPYERVRDHDALIALFEQNRFWLTAYPDTSPEYMLKYMTPPSDPRYFGKLHIDVLRAEEKLSGFTAYYMEYMTIGRILFLCIDSTVRNKGYGKQLMRYALDKLKNLGAKKVILTTRTFNYPAQKVYKGLGFVETSRDEEEYVNFEYIL
jgi:ribosomal protein S18 acetylase RimI-like enzyme